MSAMLHAQGITKRFANGRGAFAVDLQLQPGSITGFVGPNGAGKTTTMSMLAGYIWVDSGKIQIFEHSMTPTTAHMFNPRLGILLSEPSFDGFVSAGNILHRLAQLRGCDACTWHELAERFQLNTQTRFAELSLGNKKKVGLIAAVMHKPDLLILDEPTSGLDPIMQKEFAELIQGIAAAGGSVLLSSHVLTEVQSMCDQLVMIQDGKVILTESTQILLAKLPKKIMVERHIPQLTQQWLQAGLISDVRTHGEVTTFYTTTRREMVEELVRWGVFEFTLEKPGLEELFTQQFFDSTPQTSTQT